MLKRFWTWLRGPAVCTHEWGFWTRENPHGVGEVCTKCGVFKWRMPSE